MLRIGYHVSIQGGLDMAFERATGMGCTAMQIFMSNPREWSMKELGKEESDSFISKIKSSGISPVVAHMPYLPNIASPNDLVHGKSVDALGATLRRCRALGIRHLVTHLGSDLGKGKRQSTCPVGKFPKGDAMWNGSALHDMAGNVWEWTSTYYCSYDPGESKSCARDQYVARGGSWSNDGPAFVRAGVRSRVAPAEPL